MEIVPTKEEVHAARIGSWYDAWKDHSIKTIFVELSQPAANWIEYGCSSEVSSDCDSDGDEQPSKMPNADEIDRFLRDAVKRAEGNVTDSDDESSNYSVLEHHCSTAFPDIHAGITSACEKLGGKVWPKLEWATPTDAGWVIGSVTGPSAWSSEQVWEVLRGSNKVGSALSTVRELGVTRPTLALRKEVQMKENAEFRIFVSRGRVLAISQRFPELFFEYDLEYIQSVRQRVMEFWHEVKGLLEGSVLWERAVVDVYLGRPPKSKVWVVDISHWGGATLPLLFDWEELSVLQVVEEDIVPEVRYITTRGDCHTSNIVLNRLPVELQAVSGAL